MRLLNTSAESETRILTRVGVMLLLSVVLATSLYLVVNPFGHKPRDVISVTIETPYVGQGVAVGTPVIMHGATIGQVVSVSSISGGGVRLKTDLQRGPTRGLTDSMGIDYRPSNYFGVTGINILPVQSGRPLHNGTHLNITPTGNFALQALLYRLGELSHGVFDQRLISVIERTTRYVDGLNPLLETALTVATSVAKVQTVSTERLLRNTTGISVALPGMTNALISIGNDVLHTYCVDFDSEEYKKLWKYWPAVGATVQRHFETAARLERESRGTDDFYDKHVIPAIDTARVDLFSRVGYLLSSHINDLSPVVESVRALAETVPKIVSPDSFAYTITELRRRFEHMYAGTDDQRALQVRIVLDRLPGVAGPLGMMMAEAP